MDRILATRLGTAAAELIAAENYITTTFAVSVG